MALTPPPPPDNADAPTAFWRTPDGALHGGWSLRARALRCPDAWRDAGDGACEPDPDAPCADGATRVANLCVGGTARCATGDFADVSGPAVYVDARVHGGDADGTRAHPFARLSDALARAPAGATVLLSAGVWREPVRIPRNVQIVGACADRTVIESAGEGPAVDGAGATFTLANVTVRGGSEGVVARAGASLTLRDAVVEGAVRAGVRVDGARAALEDVVVRGVIGVETLRAAGVFATAGADVSLDRVLIDDVDATGLNGELRSRLRVRDVAIRNVRRRDTVDEPGAPPMVPNQCPDPLALPSPERGGTWSEGVFLQFGAQLDASRLVVERVSDTGFFVVFADTRVTLRDSVIRDVTGLPDETEGKGLHLLSGPRVELDRVLIERTRVSGVSSFCPRAHAELHDVVVRDTSPRRLGTGGRGLTAQWGGTLTAHRTIVRRSFNAGAMAYNGSTITLVDTALLDTRASTDPFSAAVIAFADCRVRLDHVLLDGWEEGAIASAETGSTVSVHQVIAMRGRQSARGVGLGVAAAANGTVEGDTFALLDAPGVGLFADGARRNATVRLADVWIDGVTRGVSRGFYLTTVGASDDTTRPRLLGASSGGTVELTRAHLSRSPLGFVLAGDPGGALTLRDTVIHDVSTLGVDVGGAPPRSARLRLERVAGPTVRDPTVRDALP